MWQRVVNFTKTHYATTFTSATVIATSWNLHQQTSYCEELPEQTRSKRSNNFVGIFLDEESKERLKEKYNFKYKEKKGHHVTLKFNPSKEELHAFEPIIGHEAEITVHAYGEDDNAQAVLISAKTKDGLIEYDGQFPHITLSVTGQEGYSAAYSNVLFERMHEKGTITMEETEDGTHLAIKEAKEHLNKFESKLLPYYNPYPETNGRIEVLDESLTLRGIICTSSRFDEETCTCKEASAEDSEEVTATVENEPEEEKAECGFCVFMRAGPCGDEFRAWETCLEQCKEKGEDFIEKCGPQTLVLRDCVDLNPEYYKVLSDEEERQNREKSNEESSSAPSEEISSESGNQSTTAVAMSETEKSTSQ